MIAFEMRNIDNGVHAVGGGETKLVRDRTEFPQDLKWPVVLHEKLTPTPGDCSQELQGVDIQHNLVTLLELGNQAAIIVCALLMSLAHRQRVTCSSSFGFKPFY